MVRRRGWGKMVAKDLVCNTRSTGAVTDANPTGLMETTNESENDRLADT